MATLAVVHACDLPTAPRFPDSAIPLEVPETYRTWWALTAACSGVSADFESVHWYVVPGAHSIPYGGSEYQGLWYRGGNRIVLAEQSVRRGALVRHEMLHALLGRVGHPREFYRDRCGGVVACAGECERETQATVETPVGARQMLATELELEMEILTIPADPEHEGTGHDAWLGVMVSARNPHGESGIVPLGASGAPPPLPTFGYSIAAAGAATARQTYEFAGDTVLVFAPGETRRRLFDVWLPSQDWEVRGLFASGGTVAVRVAVGR